MPDARSGAGQGLPFSCSIGCTRRPRRFLGGMEPLFLATCSVSPVAIVPEHPIARVLVTAHLLGSHGWTPHEKALYKHVCERINMKNIGSPVAVVHWRERHRDATTARVGRPQRPTARWRWVAMTKYGTVTAARRESVASLAANCNKSPSAFEQLKTLVRVCSHHYQHSNEWRTLVPCDESAPTGRLFTEPQVLNARSGTVRRNNGEPTENTSDDTGAWRHGLRNPL